MKPLAIDLFCGLFQSQVFLRANATVKQFVACRAQYPDHMGMCIARQPPRAIALKLGLVGNFENAAFTARLACIRDARTAAVQSIKGGILKVSLRLINGASSLVFSPRPNFPVISCCSDGTFVRAISLVAIWRLYLKMRATAFAISAFLGRSLMFLASDASSPMGAVIAAPFFIGALSSEWVGTKDAKQIVHVMVIAE